MKDFWNDYPDGNKNLLRLLTGARKWLAWSEKDGAAEDAGSKRILGCRDQVEDALTEALHSTNVVVLLGSGESFCAKNEGEAKAPGMWHLWHAVRDAYGQGQFDEIVRSVMGNVPIEGKENIEGLLSLCKMSIELMTVRSENDKASPDGPRLATLKAFIRAAEKTILRIVDFVDGETDLPAHTGFVRKFARRSP